MNVAPNLAGTLVAGRPLALTGVADGAQGLVIADLARTLAARLDAPAISLAVVCRDGARMAALRRALEFFAPDLAVLEYPAWDCLPYDRVSPHAGFIAQRMAVLSPHQHKRRASARAGTRIRRAPVALRCAWQRARHGTHHRLARA